MNKDIHCRITVGSHVYYGRMSVTVSCCALHNTTTLPVPSTHSNIKYAAQNHTKSFEIKNLHAPLHQAALGVSSNAKALGLYTTFFNLYPCGALLLFSLCFLLLSIFHRLVHKFPCGTNPNFPMETYCLLTIPLLFLFSWVSRGYQI